MAFTHSTLQDADRIVVMQKGVIAEQGTHAQLLELKGVYHKLVMRQLQSEELEGTSSSSI
jgi:ABC-type multidrug transport system fused ATPase/permease subunit